MFETMFVDKKTHNCAIHLFSLENTIFIKNLFKIDYLDWIINKVEIETKWQKNDLCQSVKGVHYIW